MSKYRNTLFYITVTAVCAVLIAFLLTNGKGLENAGLLRIPVSSKSHFVQFLDNFTHNQATPLAVLLAQIVVILLVGSLFGYIASKMGQPRVIGETLAGIALGPSLTGRFFPHLSAVLFPAASLGNLQFLSQIGLIIFMFVIGMELDVKAMRNKTGDALVISHASIIIPFTLGMGLAYIVYPQIASPGIPFFAFSLFFGIATSITAFPVLARICQERGINKTKLGYLVITCAATDDVTAWCILAIVVAVVKAGSVVSAAYTIALAVVYVLVMLKAVKPLLEWFYKNYLSKKSGAYVGVLFLTLIISAYATEVIGIHALFGAFLAGIVMPADTAFRDKLIEKIKDVALFLLLPLFFVFTGLRTQVGLLDSVYLWEVCGMIILVAVTGKFVGSALAARFVGQSWKDSLSIGALMNTRGLMELIVLNIGYDLGVISKQVFAMMVIMALVTTLMTVPTLDLINKIFRRPTANL